MIDVSLPSANPKFTYTGEHINQKTHKLQAGNSTPRSSPLGFDAHVLGFAAKTEAPAREISPATQANTSIAHFETKIYVVSEHFPFRFKVALQYEWVCAFCKERPSQMSGNGMEYSLPVVCQYLTINKCSNWFAKSFQTIIQK